MIRLNQAQLRHLANSLRAVGLIQLAAVFWFMGIRASNWVPVVASFVLLILFELAALRLLRDVEDAP